MGRAPRGGVFGPYRNGSRYTVERRTPDGERRYRSFATSAEAEAYAAEARADLVSTDTTIEQAIEIYEEHLIDKGNAPVSYTETVRRLRLFFDPVLASPLYRLTDVRAKRLYARLVDGFEDEGGRKRTFSADTHRNILAEARSFVRWGIAEHAWLATNPLEGIKGKGKRKKGPESKAQLTIDEARAWLAKAIELAGLGDLGALAAAMSLLLGVRASEIVERQVRDVDDEGRILRIPRGKTKAARRQVEMPEPLRGPLTAATRGRGGAEWLFPAEGESGKHWRDWVRKNVRRICDLAKVPKVTAHGMRGLHSSLSVAAGVTSHVVASSLGHESFATTKASYADPAAVDGAQRKTALTILDGGIQSTRRRRR